MLFRHTMSRRDALLVLLGASLMYIFSVLFMTHTTDSIIIDTHLHNAPLPDLEPLPPPPDPFKLHVHNEGVTQTVLATVTQTVFQERPVETGGAQFTSGLPETSIIHHAPGWTLFRNLYMSDGTIYILSNNRSFPEFRMITSTGLAALNTPENIALREPTARDMDFITPEGAKRLWGTKDGEYRVLTVEGNTVLFNDPSQFLRHYYHFVAELFLGVQAFWHGAFSAPTISSGSAASVNHHPPPPIHRAIFAHSNADGWRDSPGFNSYFLRAAFPSLTVEVQEDWDDRIKATAQKDRAWHFPLVLFTDRSAAHRGVVCGTQTQRTAAEAWDFMRKENKLMGMRVGGWWEPVRKAVLKFASVSPMTYEGGVQEVLDVDPVEGKEVVLPRAEKIVITYISRQVARTRKLTPEAHEGLVSALEELVARKGSSWELNILAAEKLTKDEQLQYIGRTTILLGVHGNGLTHLVFMPPTRASTVIEIFYPGGFAHDYQWTTRALGMSHFAVWNDTYHTYPSEPRVAYPEGFQENYIPVHGPTVAKIIEDRVDGNL